MWQDCCTWDVKNWIDVVRLNAKNEVRPLFHAKAQCRYAKENSGDTDTFSFPRSQPLFIGRDTARNSCGFTHDPSGTDR
jgi:Tfp pilus assembly protein PilP